MYKEHPELEEIKEIHEKLEREDSENLENFHNMLKKSLKKIHRKKSLMDHFSKEDKDFFDKYLNEENQSSKKTTELDPEENHPF